MRRALLLLPLTASFAFASEVYFSPDGGIQDQLIRRINASETSIDVAVYSFTNGNIAQALAEAKMRGVTIRVIRDLSQTSNKHDEDVFLERHGIAVKVLSGRPPHGVMHDKFAIFDKKVVETGSFNWTVNGEKYSHENALFFDDPRLIKAFQQEFDRLWRGAEYQP
jgi:phosphatidylserine/phosphatidylglycerophosphate/cardiolipin synthase-like enzyme